MRNPERVSVGVVGGGSWGTALAALLARKGHRVTLWVREEDVLRGIRQERENRSYLPGVPLPDELEATGELEAALLGHEIVLWAVPAQFVRELLARTYALLGPDVQVVSAAKGIEADTGLRMDEVFAEYLTPRQRERFTVLSGPSFAVEVAQEIPTAVVVASRSSEMALRAQRVFQTQNFRVYTNTDVVGVELAGALKNVIAIAAGAVTGLGLGHNTLAALITRGLAEISRLGMALGASPATFAGLAGLGDLVLTCTGPLSRNRTVGYRLGQGEPLDRILAELRGVAEGVHTVRAVVELARRAGVQMPISEEVFAIVWEGRRPQDAIRSLMTREPKAETGA